jgi:alkylation response protein AidB-like acyl-CoA dehydrogenase
MRVQIQLVQKTTAAKGGKGYILNGSKNFITNGEYADVHVTLAVTDKKMRPRIETHHFSL